MSRYYNENRLGMSVNSLPKRARNKKELLKRDISWIISHSGNHILNQYSTGLTLKRSFDILVSALFLCTLFPFIYIVVGLAIKCTSSGPILFRQKRHGKDGRIFVCLKFRSMFVNHTADSEPSRKNDPRVTPLGKFLRRTFIDELPQFINVLRGDMSIIGPRPHMLDDTRRFSRYAEGYMRRLTVRPGITGLAQVSGYRGEVRDDNDLAGRIMYDLWYIDHWSFSLDLCVFFKTVRNFLIADY